MVSSRACLIAIVASVSVSAVLLQAASAQTVLAQNAIGGPNKPKSNVGGPTTQVNPVVPVHPGSTPTPKPKK